MCEIFSLLLTLNYDQQNITELSTYTLRSNNLQDKCSYLSWDK